MGFFSKIKEGLKKTHDKISFALNKLFTGGALNDEFYDELEEILISADVGVDTTEEILERLKEVVDEKLIRTRENVRVELKAIIKDILDESEAPDYSYPLVIMVAGVNSFLIQRIKNIRHHNYFPLLWCIVFSLLSAVYQKIL